MSDPLHLYPTNIEPRPNPKLLARKPLGQCGVFQAEKHHLEFANGTKRTYECLQGSKRGAVLVIAVTSQKQVLLIREYCGGRERYELAFPKGKLETNESFEAAAMRELQEETGYAAGKISAIKTVTVAPGYMAHKTHIMLAEELYWQPLVGDEPEPMEVYPWPLERIDELLQRPDFTEARSIVALLMLQHYPALTNLIEVS